MSEEQPMPTPGREDVYPVARDAFTDMLDGRTRIGRDRYGEPLQTHNGRNAFQDAMEEAVDLWQYLIQARLEHDDLKQELLAEQHINRRLTRTILEVQGERDALRARVAEFEESPHKFCSHGEGQPCRLDDQGKWQIMAEELGGSLSALLTHYTRYTTHRCEINQDAETALTCYRALLSSLRMAEVNQAAEREGQS